jgi:hypothetical protein
MSVCSGQCNTLLLIDILLYYQWPMIAMKKRSTNVELDDARLAIAGNEMVPAKTEDQGPIL